MSFVKKLIGCVLCAGVLFAPAALAKNNVSEIAIDVTLRDDGSAYVVQNWTGEFNEGTENYIPINTGDIEISDFSVSDIDGTYEFVDDWDVNAGFDEKKRKCGINPTDTGVELCFGISEYGEHRYAIEYVVTDFIKSYSDYDGTNFMLINPDTSTFPTDGRIRIVTQDGTPLSAENAAIWAFGYEGKIDFADGGVTAYTTVPLEGSNSMIVMLRLNRGIVSPTKMLSASFDEVKDEAFAGSDYGDAYADEEATPAELAIGLIIMLLFLAIPVLIVRSMLKRKKEIKKFCSEAGYFRDVPNHGDIEVSHYLAQTFDVANDESLIIGALLLSMINKRCIEPQTEKKIGFFGKVNQSVNMKLLKEPDTGIEKRLYNILVGAAGEDGILQEKELENYAYANPETVNGIIDDAKSEGMETFRAHGGFTAGVGRRIRDLSPMGREELSEVVGLKKYLEEFSLIAEREISEVEIWKEYMIYATLFGIADKVMKQLEKVYPDRIPEFEDYNRNVIIAHSYYRSIHCSAERALQEQRTSGLGGNASIGGGGGFSGGGSGGGSR